MLPTRSSLQHMISLLPAFARTWPKGKGWRWSDEGGEARRRKGRARDGRYHLSLSHAFPNIPSLLPYKSLNPGCVKGKGKRYLTSRIQMTRRNGFWSYFSFLFFTFPYVHSTHFPPSLFLPSSSTFVSAVAREGEKEEGKRKGMEKPSLATGPFSPFGFWSLHPSHDRGLERTWEDKNGMVDDRRERMGGVASLSPSGPFLLSHLWIDDEEANGQTKRRATPISLLSSLHCLSPLRSNDR